MIEDKNTLKRFYDKVEKGQKGECWNWIAAKTSKGYGCFKLKGKVLLAHRLSYLISVGQINPKMDICHHCDNPSCVNPNHLFQGSRSENMKDSVRKGRFVSNGSAVQFVGRTDHRVLSDEQVLEVRELIKKESS
jgi:hypothetical protein